jgi:glyoxylase-like metal-dependent hydrolase (beta-lactamase superfamily II)
VIHKLPIPTPFAVGRVNVWLVEDDPLTLVDAGPNSATSLTELEAALAARGRRVEDLGRIVVTHPHIDHIGLVDILAQRSGAEVCALDRLAPWLERYSTSMEEDDAFAEAIMLRHGIPPELALGLRAVTQGFRAWGHRASVDHPLADGAELAFAARTWRVHHRPGHSPSDTIFHDERSGEVLGGEPPARAHLLQSAPLAAARGRRGRRGEAPAGADGLPRLAAGDAGDGGRPRRVARPRRRGDRRGAHRRALRHARASRAQARRADR